MKSEIFTFNYGIFSSSSQFSSFSRQFFNKSNQLCVSLCAWMGIKCWCVCLSICLSLFLNKQTNKNVLKASTIKKKHTNNQAEKSQKT